MGIVASTQNTTRKYSKHELRLINKQMEADKASYVSNKARAVIATISEPEIRKVALFFKPREEDTSTDQIEQENTCQL